MGSPPLWEHLLKAYEHVNLPHLSNLYHTSTASPQIRLWFYHISTKLDCGYTKPTPEHTHRLYKLHMRCTTCHCQAMQDHIAITAKPSTLQGRYTCTKENIASGKRALYAIRLTYERKLVYVYFCCIHFS